MEVLTNLRGLTVKLQMQAGDVSFAYYSEVSEVLTRLKGMRSTLERERGNSLVFLLRPPSWGKTYMGTNLNSALQELTGDRFTAATLKH